MSIALFWWSRKFIYFFFFLLLQFCYWQCKVDLPRLPEQYHLQLHFFIVEVTRNVLFYELDVLYIFDINKVCPCELYEFIWFLIWQTSTIRKAHGDEIAIFAWQWYYFQYVRDSEILKSKLLERWIFAFKNTLLDIEPTQQCCIGKSIFLCLLEKQKAL